MMGHPTIHAHRTGLDFELKLIVLRAQKLECNTCTVHCYAQAITHCTHLQTQCIYTLILWATNDSDVISAHLGNRLSYHDDDAIMPFLGYHDDDVIMSSWATIWNRMEVTGVV